MTRKALFYLRLARWMRENGARLSEGTDPEGERLYRTILKRFSRMRLEEAIRVSKPWRTVYDPWNNGEPVNTLASAPSPGWEV